MFSRVNTLSALGVVVTVSGVALTLGRRVEEESPDGLLSLATSGQALFRNSDVTKDL